MKKLTKSANNRVVSGVLGGIGEFFNIDPTILRIIFVILIFIGYGTVIPVYIVAFLIIPDPSGKMALGERSKTKVIHKRPVKKIKPLEQDDSDDDWSDF